MARVSKYSVFILLVATMLFVAISAASADTLTPSSFVANTSATFNSVSVYYVDANPLANPWGLTSTCPVGCNVNPIGSDGSTPSTVETIVLRDTGTPTSAGLDVTGGIFTVHLFGSNSIFTPGTDSAPVVSNTKGTSVSYSSSLDSFCAMSACNNGTDPTVPFMLAQVAPDVFTATSNSLEIAFSLTSGTVSTPEPSVVLMLGMGLLGLMGFRAWPKKKAV